MNTKVPIAAVVAVAAALVLGGGTQAVAQPQAGTGAAACAGWTKVEAVSYLSHADGSYRRAQGTVRSVAKDTCFIELDENKYAPGWYTGWDGYWSIAKENDKGAVYKQFAKAVVRRGDGGYVESHLVDLDQLRDVAESVNCDARVTKDLADAWRADIRVYGEPNRQRTDWIRTWNEVTGFTNLGSRWRKDQCVKLTGSATKWDGHTFYETPQGQGGHYDWVRDDAVNLRRK
ncbi:hypothetical protein ACFXDE_03160 [Kitasatospora sp. NPDC059408]|uniref:hypothetical protein n=1 Tax=Kitasatospora sp. NPDC059408 TaxID=3346823 RepID=UPI0036CBED06